MTDSQTAIIDAIIDALETGKAVTLATVIRPEGEMNSPVGRKLVINQDGTTLGTTGLDSLDRRVASEALEHQQAHRPPKIVTFALTEDERQQLELHPGSEVEVFIDSMAPAPVLLIVGAGHVAQPLHRVGALLGFKVAVVDDRSEFVNRERFPDADRLICGPCVAELERFPIGPSTYVVIVTRGHAMDEEALRAVITRPAAYIGMIGSARKVNSVLRSLTADGVDTERLDRVCCPIGLDIGAQTPAEIAVGILAEIVNVRHRQSPHPYSMSVLRQSRQTAKTQGGAEADSAQVHESQEA